ncbi:hypothetical protein GNY06_00465 [Elizabethkingia argentiflava]|uniref:Transposase n=1 Tax=Elizabethkingia argenteiflava TaxID=2681556 RepID=A0A845PUZ7_9FLAO|nr:hypothetical protein [Elizabethkingia argenteiflava]NAW49930.1 hypothetical protein [Elizabethkingia argenteiflava]
MSSVQLDGSHTPSRMGGEKLGYQGRKKAKTTNSIFLWITGDKCWQWEVQKVGIITIDTK